MPDAVRDCLRVSCGFPAGLRGSGVAGFSPYGETRTATQPPQSRNPADADRWRTICLLLAEPAVESRRLAALLKRWPSSVKVHRLLDDCRRRRSGGGE